MTTIVITVPDEAVSHLIAVLAEQEGFDVVLAPPTPVELPADCVLVVEPAAQPALELGLELRRGWPRLPIVCVSVRSSFPESLALEPLIYVVIPAPLVRLRDALRLGAAQVSRALV